MFSIVGAENPYMGDQFDFIQDQGLDVIAEGLDTLKNMAGDLNEVSSYH